jgi:hypothetical protein
VLTEVESVLNSEAIELFAQALGGREKLADALAVAGSGSEVERMTTLLLDPRYAQWGLARLCRTVGLTVADLFAAYRKAAVARSHIESTHLIAGKLPAVVDDVMTRAAPQRVVCPTCAGAAGAAGACAACGGRGYVLTEPELDRQKLALELGHLLEKKGGLIVQQNNLAQTTLGATAPGSLETLQQAVGDLLFGGPRHRDVDVERETPPADLPAAADDEESTEEEPDLPFDDDARDAPPPRVPPAPPRPEAPRATSTEP